MRPLAVAEACDRVRAGGEWHICLGEFLHSFYSEHDPAALGRMLVEEPAKFKNGRYDALVGAIAEYLYKRHAPNHPPKWIGNKDRYLRRPGSHLPRATQACAST